MELHGKTAVRFYVTTSVIALVMIAVQILFSQPWAEVILSVLLSVVFVYIAFVDRRYRKIPNMALLILLTAKVFWLTVVGSIGHAAAANTVMEAFGGLLVNGFVGLLVFLFLLDRKGRLGAGDCKYIAMVGFCIGLSRMPVCCLCAMAVALLHRGWLAFRGKRAFKSHFAAAPYITAGALAALCFV